jgi:hypothetical protein
MKNEKKATARNFCEQHRKGGIQSSTVSTKPCDVCGATPSKAGFATEDEKGEDVCLMCFSEVCPVHD